MELEFQELCKTYGNTKALVNFSATLGEGIYGLLGPNGAGKSTLMNILSGNLTATTGIINFNGENIVTMGARFREIVGYMPQQQGLYDSFTAYRFLSYMAALKGMKKHHAKDRIAWALKLVNLEDNAKDKLGSFSGGMKQRVLIAQAILGDPKILILDEPTAGLDPKERIRIRNLISEISFNKIVIIATHVVSDIEFIANEVILVKKGELIAKGSPSVLLKNISGKVFEIHIDTDELPIISKLYHIRNIFKDGDHIIARVVSDAVPDRFEYNQVNPMLEDLYLYTFDK